jgi:hypothetical protein
VAYIDGKPDFRVIGPDKIATALKRKVCWICGQPLGVHLTFVIGPMCAVNRVISEPPSHHECAEYAAKTCPFLTKPRMRRNEKNIPEEAQDAVGIHIDRNPGVTCLWTTRTFRPFRVGRGVLFKLGEPERTEWYAQGRAATRDEVIHATQTGLPLLINEAKKEGPKAILALEYMYKQAMHLWPAEAAQ